MFSKRQWLSPRYAAYVLHPQGEPAWIKLGEAHEIDTAVHALREALRDPNRQDVKQLARALDAKLMQPVRQLLGATRMVLMSPDGPLHLVPFAALVDEQERYLLAQYRFIYLTTGRDLLRLQVKTEATQGPVVIADPTFSTPGGQRAPREWRAPKRRLYPSIPQRARRRGYGAARFYPVAWHRC